MDMRTSTINEREVTEAERILKEAFPESEGPSSSALRIKFQDTFTGVYKLANPWPDNGVLMQMDIVPGIESVISDSVIVSVEFLNGSDSGTVWGVDHSGAYKIELGKEKEYEEYWESEILSTYAAMFQIRPLISNAPRAVYLGKKHSHGENYDLIMVTYAESFKPDSRYDQFVVWINDQSKKLEKIEMTLRRFGKTASGCVIFDDYKISGGEERIWTLYALPNCDEKKEDYFHIISILEYD